MEHENKPTGIELERTPRGWFKGDFVDRYGHGCSIQESSLATEACIWLGINDAKPEIMARDTPQGGNGWVPFYVPKEVLLHTRMHLTQEQVAELLPLLQHFVETGYLPGRDEE